MTKKKNISQRGPSDSTYCSFATASQPGTSTNRPPSSTSQNGTGVGNRRIQAKAASHQRTANHNTGMRAAGPAYQTASMPAATSAV